MSRTASFSSAITSNISMENLKLPGVIVEVALSILENLVMITLAAIGIGTGLMTALGNVSSLRQPLVRLVASVLFVAAGLWVFYIGIRHAVSG